MRPFRNLLFALRSALASYWRNFAVSLTATITITFILGLAGINLLVGHSLAAILTQYQSRVSVITISIAEGTPPDQVHAFQAQLRADPRVESVTYISKEQALQEFQADPANADIARQIVGNPLAAKLQVKVKNLSDVAAIDAESRAWSGADPRDPTDYQGELIQRMLRISQWMTWAGWAFLGVLLFISVFIVMNTIRTAVYHRRQEIEVMKLVGATEWFVRGPFVLEGVMTGVIAASLALGVLVAAYRPFVERFQAELFFLPLSYDPRFVPVLAQDLLVAGVALGAVGGYVSVRRFVKL